MTDHISHDVIRVYDTAVQCRCGRWWDGDTLHQARARHEKHHGLEAARAALNAGLHPTDGRDA
jgi:hypothetical protein